MNIHQRVTPDDYARLKQLVAGALSRPAAARLDYLVHACDSNTDLLADARSLLDAAVRAENLFEEPAFVVDGDPLVLSTRDDEDFQGTARYDVRRRIGAGGMGIVYEVHDRVRDRIVALKSLRSRSGDDLYQLKREFRNLADVAHPNLASLYDLVIDDDLCFFTMELVAGENFVDYVRRALSGPAPDAPVRDAMVQLVEGVQALHRRGLLHRDIKPSNVLVTADGRVVILDFGLTSARLHEALIGTPAYLAPEQCDGRDVSFASDWYGVGATLYHALTGRPPFDGPVPQVLERKMTGDPPTVLELAPATPAALAGLCMSLLQRDPAARLSGQGVLDELSGVIGRADEGTAEQPPRIFVGRTSARAVLAEALTSARAGRSGSVIVHGPSGIGKSALIQQFIDERCQHGDVLLLRGRCHEHESIPYNGIDGIIDDLARHLAKLPASELAALLPASVAPLARLFPVLRALGIEAGTTGEGGDPILVRQRALHAFRDVLSGLATTQPILIDIDDFHWADSDTVKWLNALLRPPTLPSLVVVIAFRSEELDAKPFLRSLVERIDIGERHIVPLLPLSDDQVKQLLSALLPGSAVGVSQAGFIQHSGGNPFLVDALARHAALGFGQTSATLDEMLLSRLARLPAESRTFLETLALCGRPVLPSRIFQACGIRGDERQLVSRLKAAHLLRSSRVADRVELYHDRIRQVIASWVSPEVARHRNEALAQALVAAGDDDPEGLFEHFRAAGHKEQAAIQAARAAEQASAVLAFDLAATFYRHALDLHPGDARIEWTAGLARALENGGRPAEAAEMYLKAAQRGSGPDQIEWRRKAAELLLVGGQIDRGLEVSADVLRSVGMRLDPGSRSALLSLAFRRCQLWWRGLEFTHRDPSTIPPDDLLRIDASWSISAGLAMVHPLKAAAFSVRQLLKALEVGDPQRVARAIALEAGFSVVNLGSGVRRSAFLAQRAQALARAGGQHHVEALTLLSMGVTALLAGRWKEATEACGRAVVTLRDDCTGVLWELNVAHNFFLGSLLWQGEIREVARHLPGLIETARERGNFYLELELRTRMVLVWLAADQHEAAEHMADEGIARWTHRGFQRQHFNHLICRVQVELYRGRATSAWRLMSQHDTQLRRSQLLRVQHTRVEAANYHARSALAMAAAGIDAPGMRRIALRDAERITRENMPWSHPFAQLVWASVAYQEGHRERAAAELAGALAAFESQGMNLYAAACRRQLGELTGGKAGRAQTETAERWMTGQDIRDPAAMTRMITPGFGSMR